MIRSNGSLERAQIDLILRRLVWESAWNLPTQAEFLKEFTQKQDAAVDLLFRDEGCSAILALPKADRGMVLQHLERLLDRGAVPIHEKATRVAEIRADVAELRRLLAERREQDAQVVASAAKFI